MCHLEHMVLPAGIGVRGRQSCCRHRQQGAAISNKGNEDKLVYLVKAIIQPLYCLWYIGASSSQHSSLWLSDCNRTALTTSFFNFFVSISKKEEY